MQEAEAREVADLIVDTLDARNDPAALANIKERVQALTARFPVYGK
jgi:glycine hydroxymethyltransferase